MLKKTMVIALALAVAISASVVWAGQGPQHRAKNRVAAGTCLMQKAPVQNRIGTPQSHRYGPGDGTGYDGDGPKDGTGYGKKAGTCNLSGTCDGTGPHGKATKTQLQPKRPR